jgi:hypothetical protein
VRGIYESQAPATARYEPGNPLADAERLRVRAAVNVVEEMVNMISASRSYQNNVEVMNTSKDLLHGDAAAGPGLGGIRDTCFDMDIVNAALVRQPAPSRRGAARGQRGQCARRPSSTRKIS